MPILSFFVRWSRISFRVSLKYLHTKKSPLHKNNLTHSVRTSGAISVIKRWSVTSSAGYLDWTDKCESWNSDVNSIFHFKIGSLYLLNLIFIISGRGLHVTLIIQHASLKKIGMKKGCLNKNKSKQIPYFLKKFPKIQVF